MSSTLRHGERRTVVPAHHDQLYNVHWQSTHVTCVRLVGCEDLYMWIARVPLGPCVKFQVLSRRSQHVTQSQRAGPCLEAVTRHSSITTCGK
eukprot:6015398-Amphidinium_carterae.1